MRYEIKEVRMATYITGDTHGGRDIGWLWRLKGQVKPEDYLIIAGDCGLFWVDDCTADFRYWLSEFGCTVLFIDGNHDDHAKLSRLDTAQMFGADVGIAGDRLYHLRRGRVYEIEGKRWFCFGGGQSVDRGRRRPYVDWWDEEVPSREEFERGVDSLIAVRWKVDYVLTHTAPAEVLKELSWASEAKKEDPTTFMLNRFWDLLTFEKWYCGHFHVDQSVWRIRFLFNRVIEVE